MPKLTIDGIEVEVEHGLNLIQAAARIGIEVPHFCYHPSLSIVAQCRQCLVEVEGVPKVMPACNTFVRDRLVVKTDTERAVKARRAALEFILINHPLDCPICQKGGECPLQLTAFTHGPGYSRFDGPEEKKVRQKYYLSDRILYDPNRCIMCTRCVRFTDEVTKTGELGYNDRGFRKRIVIFPGKKLDNDLAGNVIDLCPVGALLDKDELHEERVWYWEFTDSICSLCSNGCNITIGVDPRRGKISRIRPRINQDVNEFWICDRGRYGFRDTQEQKRLKEPIRKANDSYEFITWEDAANLFYLKLSEVEKNGSDPIAIIASPTLTNEELFLIEKLSRIIGTENIASNIGEQIEEKKFGLISSDPYPNSQGVREFLKIDSSEKIINLIRNIIDGKITHLFVIGEDIFNFVNDDEKQNFKKALSNLSFLAVQDYKLSETIKYADLILPGTSPYEKEGTYTNDMGRVQRLHQSIEPPGIAKQDWEIICLIGQKFQNESFSFDHPNEIMEELSLSINSFNNLNYDKIGILGINKVSERN